jgi:aspartate/methionine/tyrosine aminotransferase
MKRKSDGTVEAAHTRLSSRGLAASSYGGTVTKEHHQAAAAPYDAKLRPDGYITLAVAQNSLMFDILEPKLLEMPPLTRKSCEYPPGWLGLPELRAEVASMFNKRVLRKSKLDAANVGILDSATAIVNMLAFVLCEPGDVIVTPAPFYASYKRDVEAFAQCRLAFASCGSEEDGFLPSVAGLEAAVATAKEAGQNVRCLLLSSPINPTGIVIPQQRLAELLMWARKHGLHIIADEVFALSIYGSSVASASILDEAEVASCGDVHVVWGFSKDFCLSGVRVGCLVAWRCQMSG